MERHTKCQFTFGQSTEPIKFAIDDRESSATVQVGSIACLLFSTSSVSYPVCFILHHQKIFIESVDIRRALDTYLFM